VSRVVYIAARLDRALDVRRIAARLSAMGHRVVSTWQGGNHSRRADARLSPVEHHRAAARCYAEIARVDTLILLADPKGRGSLVEFGVAVGRGLVVIVVQPDRYVTLMLDAPGVIQVANAGASLDRLLAPTAPCLRCVGRGFVIVTQVRGGVAREYRRRCAQCKERTGVAA